MNSGCSGLLQFVFKYDETKELKSTLCLLPTYMTFNDKSFQQLEFDSPLHSLSFQPRKTLNSFPSDCNYSEPVSGVVGQHIVIVSRDWNNAESDSFQIKVKFTIPTGFWITDVWHDLRCPLDINFHAISFKSLHDDAHSPKSGNEIKSTDYTEFQEVGVLEYDIGQ
jgi:hypothetical protein